MDTKGQAKNSQAGNRNYNYAKETEKETVKEFSGSGPDFSFKFDMKKTCDEVYRTPRSQAYLDIIASIDMLSATDEEIMEKLKEVVDEDTLEEFADMTPEELLEELRLCFEEEMLSREVEVKTLPEPEILIGVISKCYITGCDIHAIDKHGNILEHFEISKHMPKDLAIGRILYKKNPNCHSIEIYSNCCRIIGSDGSVTRVDKE